MTPIEINSVVETYNNRVIIRDYKTKNFEDGTKVQTVEVRSYAITLYGSNGQLEQHSSKGDKVDLKA